MSSEANKPQIEVDKSQDEVDKLQTEVDKPRLTLLNLIGSVILGALGVQTTERRERDFQQGSGWHFFIAGAVFFICVVVGLIMLVNYIANG